MELLAIILVVAALARPVAWLASGLLGTLAWFMLAAVAVRLVSGAPVFGGLLVVTVAVWLVRQCLARLRKGYWASRLMERASQAQDAYRAST